MKKNNNNDDNNNNKLSCEDIKRYNENGWDMLKEFDKEILGEKYCPIQRYFGYRSIGEDVPSKGRKKRECYQDVDTDVSIGNMKIYQKMHDFLEGDIKTQKNEEKKYEIEIVKNGGEGKIKYRGDTMTSGWTVFKECCKAMYESEGADANFIKLYEKNKKKEGRLKKQVIFYMRKQNSDFSEKEEREFKENNFYYYVINEYEKHGLLEAVNEFYSSYFLIGNYIEMPKNVNSARSNFGKSDTIDKLLLDIYIHYKSNPGFNNKVEDKMNYTAIRNLCNNSPDPIGNSKDWLSRFDNWNDFVDKHLLQDFVKKKPNKQSNEENYGPPISLKTGNVIDNSKWRNYKPLPNTIDEFKNFFNNFSMFTKARTDKIEEKLEESLKQVENE